MPSYPVYRPPAPSNSGGSILDIILRRGDYAAENARQNGAIWGNALAGAGQVLAGGIMENAAANATKKRTAALDSVFNGPEPPSLGQLVRVLGPKDGADVYKGLAAIHPDAAKNYGDRMTQFRDVARGIKALPEERRAAAYQVAVNGLVNGGVAKPGEVPEYSPDVIEMYANYGADPSKQDDTAVVGGALVNKRTGKALYIAPKEPPKPAEPRVVGRSLVGPDGRVIYRDPAEPRADNEPLMAVIGDDGKPVYMPRSRAVGRTPASNREQGRPVTSGDAGKVADLDTSLDDLGKLRAAVTGNGATGTSARVGAALPNFVTEATGIGTEAKQKQATIDRVKQVIGKALEGGVLRKEDEYKYEKILPTIGDTPAVVESKLQGLEQAIALRRQRTLESLADAGYDTVRFESRAPQVAGPAPAAGVPVRVSSPAEAARLPKGTMFQTPDGRIMRVP